MKQVYGMLGLLLLISSCNINSSVMFKTPRNYAYVSDQTIGYVEYRIAPNDIIGKQVVVVANLAPRKMRGIESNGMILMAEDKNGKLYFVAPDVVVENGSGVS